MSVHAYALPLKVAPGGDVGAPAHPSLVKQVGDVGPRIRLAAEGRTRRQQGRAAAHRVRGGRALRGPTGDEPQVSREAPGLERLKKVVLQYEVARGRPVVRNLA